MVGGTQLGCSALYVKTRRARGRTSAGNLHDVWCRPLKSGGIKHREGSGPPAVLSPYVQCLFLCSSVVHRGGFIVCGCPVDLPCMQRKLQRGWEGFMVGPFKGYDPKCNRQLPLRISQTTVHCPLFNLCSLVTAN